jgi:cobalt transporter subunit CbtB
MMAKHQPGNYPAVPFGMASGSAASGSDGGASVAVSGVWYRTRAATALFLASLGLVFLFGAGFAHANLLHNAAHDSRHAFTFPCH